MKGAVLVARGEGMSSPPHLFVPSGVSAAAGNDGT